MIKIVLDGLFTHRKLASYERLTLYSKLYGAVHALRLPRRRKSKPAVVMIHKLPCQYLKSVFSKNSNHSLLFNRSLRAKM